MQLNDKKITLYVDTWVAYFKNQTTVSAQKAISFYRDGKVSLVFIRSLLTFENPPLGIVPHCSLRQRMSDLNRFSSVANRRPADWLQAPCWESDWSVPVTAVTCHTC